MLARLRRGLTFANVVSSLCLFVVLGGGAYAATSIVGDDGEIDACYATKGKQKGAVRLIRPGTKCRRGEAAISWRQKGEAGPAGMRGLDGLPGPAGAEGAPGSRGLTGPTGPQGTDGSAGPAGPTGLRGLAGPAGPTGPRGADGSAGPAGPTGLRGLAGPAGPTGPRGADGSAGPAGPTGPRGPAGPAAAAINLVASPGEEPQLDLPDGLTLVIECPSNPQRQRLYLYAPTGSGVQWSGVRATNDANAAAVTGGRTLEPNTAGVVFELAASASQFARQNGSMVIHGAGPMKTFVYDAFLDFRGTTPTCRLRGTIVSAG